MKSTLILTALIYSQSASALPDLLASHACESMFCVDWNGVWGTVGAWIDKLQVAPPEILRKEAPETPPATAAPVDIEIFVTVPPSAQGQCDSQGDPGSVNFRPCEEAKEHVIWPHNCQDTAKNIVTGRILSGMDRNYLTSINPGCAVEGGVGFWVAKLTPKEIEVMKHQRTAVKEVVPNVSWISGHISASPAGWKIPARQRRSHAEKRATVSVVKQEAADDALSFLSTPSEKQISGTYTYFSQAGEGVRVYVLDLNFDPQHPEFGELTNRKSIRILDALKSDQQEVNDRGSVNPDPFSKHYGTCIASKIAGVIVGVAKNIEELIMVKRKSDVASQLDALARVIADLKNDPRPSKGRTVINMTGGFVPGANTFAFGIYMQQLMQILTGKYEALLVTSAGIDYSGSSWTDVNTWPALLSPGEDIITVGSVLASIEPRAGLENGQRFPWSRAGHALTVSAPGNGLCAGPDNELWNVVGDAISSGTVSGLVAYFLSLPDLGTRLRAMKNTPKAVKTYLQIMSSKRYMAQKSVWNGLDSEDATLMFDNWFGTPVP